jgi:hypothetical protein
LRSNPKLVNRETRGTKESIMAIGRISGPLLKSNLIRNGVDLAFENDLLYLDVSDPNPANHKVGIKKSNPEYTLDVAGVIRASSILTPSFSVDVLVAEEVNSDLTPSETDTYVLGTAQNRWAELNVGQIAVDALLLDGNRITIIDSNADIELLPVGSGTVWINSDTALRIPLGTQITRPSGLAGQIRFNSDNKQFEGFNGIGWTSLGATRDVDGNTQITAELITGANDNTFRFYNDGVITGTWDINKLNLHKLTVDDNLILDENVITTTRDNTNLELRAHGTGKIYIPGNNLDIDNDLNVDGVTTLDETTIDGTLDVNGLATIADVRVTNNLTVDGNIFGDYIQTNDIQISGTVITTTASNTDLQLQASGTGRVRIEENLTVTGNTILNGDLQIDGQDLTSSTTTFNLVNTTATTVNFAGAATTIEIGAATGTTSINNNLTVDGNVVIGNASSDTVLLNSNTINVPNQVTLSIDDANNTFVSYPLNVRHTTSGTPANGMGTGIRFVAESANNVTKIAMSVDAVSTDVTSATEDFDFVVRLMDDGNLAAERFRVSSVGDGTLVGNIAVQGGTISTNSATANIVNGTATRVNFAGAATRVEIGAPTGTTNINNNLDVDGNINVDGGNITASTANLNIANTPTTVDAFRAATTINIGADTGTTTIHNDLVVDGGITVNNQSEIRFREADSNGTEYVSIRSPNSIPESYEIRLPRTNGRVGQILSTDGNGQLQWSAADTLVGNRLYVSAEFGNDTNNGFDAPVKTIKRAAELINKRIYTPKRTVTKAERDTEEILNANRDYLRAEVIGFIDSNFAFEYNKATCARDTGLIVQGLAFDLLFDGNTQSTFAGLRYWAQAAASVPIDQLEETIAAIVHARDVAYLVVQNTAVTKQVGNTQTQNVSLPTPSAITAADSIKAKFDTIISIITNGTSGVTDSIIDNGAATSDADTIKAYDILQANKLFIQDDTIAYVNNNFAFTYQPLGTLAGQEICSRDTGLIVQSLAFDLLYSGNTQSAFAGRRYYDRGTSVIIGDPAGDQIDETLAAINYAKTVAQAVVLNQPVTTTVGNDGVYPQVFNIDNPGSGAGSTAIGNNFDRIVDIIDGTVAAGDISTSIVNNGARSTSNSVLNTYNLLLANKEFIKEETIAWINNNFLFDYDQVKCERDSNILIDTIKYDIALGTNWNAVTSGRAYQRAYSTFVETDQLPQTLDAIGYIKTQVAAAIVGNSNAITRSNAAFDEVIDILANGVVNENTLTYPLPTGTSAEIQAVRDQLIANRAFLAAEVVAFVNANPINPPPPGIDVNVCGRDTGYIVDGIIYDMVYGGNSASVESASAYFEGTTNVIRNYEIDATIDAYERLKVVIRNVVRGIAVVKTAGNALSQSGIGGAAATVTEADTIDDLIDIINNAIINDGDLPTIVYPSLTWIAGSEFETAKLALDTAGTTIAAATITYLNGKYRSLVGDANYSDATCARDLGYIVDSIAVDLVHGGNRQATQAGVYYYGFDAGDINIPTEIPQTVAAYTYLKDLVTAVVLDQDPAVSYQDYFDSTLRIERTPGVPATTTQADLIKADIDLIINIIENGPSVAPNPAPIAVDGYNPTTNVIRAFNLLRDNEAYIRAELIGYIANEFSQIVGYDSVKCKRDVGYIVDSISFDMKYGGNRQTIQSGVYYYSNSLSVTTIPGQGIQTAAAFNYLKQVAAAVIVGGAYTPLQNVVPRVTSGANATVDEYNIVEADINRIINIINGGPSQAEAAQSISLTPVNDVDVVAAHNRLVANEEFIKAEVTQFIDNTFTGLVYNKEICSRDVGYIIDSAVYDLIFGGNAKSVYAGNRYYQGSTSTTKVINEQKPETVAAIEYLATIAENILEDENPAIAYTSAQRTTVSELVTLGTVTTTTATRASATASVKAKINLIADVLDSPGLAPAVDFGPGYFAATGSIFVASGDYVEDNPLIIPDNTAVIGGDLRSVIIRPANSNKDIFRLRNGSYMSGFTWRDNVDANKVPQFTFDFATTFDNPADTTLSRGSYPYMPLQKPIISQSPYIQNVSIISFLGGGGALIDGNLVETPNFPPVLAEVEVSANVTFPLENNFIPEQGKSMVANAYTMVSFGGIGWKLINDAYAQIVSCFQIFLLEGVVCQSGGYCSITNSATNFGLYALRASGYSNNAFTFDRGVICSTGVAVGAQTITAIGMLRTPVNEFVIRIRNQSQADDITNQFLTAREQFLFDPATVNPATNIFTIPNHGLANRQRVTYFNNGGISIGGLENGINYYINQVSIDEFKLFFDETLTIEIDITSAGSGGATTDNPPTGAGPEDSTFHQFSFVVEEFFVKAIRESHSVFQRLILSTAQGGVYAFNPGTTITGTTVITGNVTPNNAFVLSYDVVTRELVVAVNTVTINNIPQRILFDATSIITIDQSTVPVSNIAIATTFGTGLPNGRDPVEDVDGLVSSTFTIESTVVNSLLQGVAGLPGLRIWFHRPSIVNSSSHTWEYAGSGIDYNALPQNGGQTREEYEQFTEAPGRVYTSGTNELGDFKVGTFIVAENKTGNISFRNEVTVGQLNALRLSLSDIEINKISNDPGLGDNEPGGASDSALITQLSIRTFIANRLGNVLDKQVSTNANAGALVQLNSSGQINRDLIPPLRTTNTVTVNGFNARLNVSEDQPAIDVLASDTVVETYTTRTLTLSGPITVLRGSIIKQTTSGAQGVVVLDVSAGSSVEVANIVGTFTTTPAHILTNASNVPLGAGSVYPTVVGALSSIQQVPYVLTTDTLSQFLVLFDKTTGVDYAFTNGNLVTSTINPAVGQITAYRSGVVVDLNTLTYNRGTAYTPTTGTLTYRDVPLTGGTGTGAVADITVTNGLVQNVDLRRGGTGYVVGQSLSASNTNIGGTGANFSIPITNTEQRLYVDLVDAVKFIPTSTVFDFIADNNASVKTISNLTGNTSDTFNAADISGGGSVDYSTSRITIVGHGYSNGDPVIYTSGLNTPIGSLVINGDYHIKVISNDVFEVYSDYNLVTKVSFTSSSTGTHTFTILPTNFLNNFVYVPAHGFVTGDPVELAGADIPSGLTAPRYFVGSVTVNSFTLHQLRLDALASISGVTINSAPLIDAGTGSMTLTLQNVQIIGNINTSSTNEDAWVLLSTTNVDASNIISGIIATSRLGSGTANTETFLRGDSTFQTVVQSVRPSVGSPISITGSFITLPGEDSTVANEYFGDIRLDIIRASDLEGDVNFTNTGIASFSKGQFEVSNTGQVSVKSGRIDALSLGGLQASYFLDPSNLTTPVPVNRGGTGLNSLPSGSMVYGSTSTTATALSIGSANSVMISTGSVPAWSPNLALVGDFSVNGDTTIGNAAGDGFTVNSEIMSVPNLITIEKDDTTANSILYPLSVRRSTSGSPAVGIGTGVQLVTETSGNNFEAGTIFESVTTSVTPTAENFAFVLKVMTAGAAAAQVLRLVNNLVTVGAINTNTTITTQGTGSLTLNTNNGTNSGTITITSGVSGNISITPNGAGTVQIGKTTNIVGDLTVTGGTSFGGVAITSSSVTGVTTITDLDTFNKTIYRSAKYTIQVQCTAGPNSGAFQASEILVIHTGTDAFMTDYAVIKSNGNTLATFTVDVAGDNIRLRATASASDTVTIKAIRLAQGV